METIKEEWCFMCQVHGLFKSEKCPNGKLCNNVNIFKNEQKKNTREQQKIKTIISKDYWEFEELFKES